MSIHIITENTVTILHNDRSVIYARQDQNNRNWERIITALRRGEYDEALALAQPLEAVKAYMTDSPFTIDSEGKAYYYKEPVHGALVERILRMHERGFPIEPMVRFFCNLQLNPSFRAVNELYSFLEACNLPITEDGCFLAYKRIRDNYTDVHSGKINNAVGTHVEMERSKVDDNPSNTCSAGLHACSLNYLRSFDGSRIVVVKIHPRDVVSVPIDYGNSKMRVCAYDVVRELTREEWPEGSDVWEEPVATEDGEDAEPTEYSRAHCSAARVSAEEDEIEGEDKNEGFVLHSPTAELYLTEVVTWDSVSEGQGLEQPPAVVPTTKL